MRPRQLVLVTGDPASTARAVADALAELPPTRVAWIAPEPLVPELPYVALSPRQLPRALGRSFDVVVLDGHGGGIEADALGQAHGLVLGGGALVLRVDSENTPLDPEARARLAASPYTGAEVGQRFQTHLRRTLARFATPLPDRFTPADRPDRGSAEQAAVVAAIVDAWVRAPGQAQVLTADRGRGKSSALGLALAELARSPNAAYRARLVTGPSEAAVAELLRFANRDDPRTARFVPLLELLAAPVATQPGEPGPILIVDEAAQLPVPLLQRLVLAHPAASFAFATTTHGYEGTGRGFTLRFLNWLRARGPVIEHGLTAPIRWAGDDPVEAAVFAALLLDAEPAAGPFPAADDPDAEPRFERLDRDALIADAAGLRRLRELFGLLIHAHYRTTPGDLERLLDAPNLEVHAALLGDPDGDRVVAANLVAREGALPPPLTADAAAGKTRLRAHALADVLVAHLGHPEAGALAMRRSVRLATHPALRRRGLARALVEHTHALAAREDQPPELFGTLFGATPELVAFRRALGYRLVRVSA